MSDMDIEHLQRVRKNILDSGDLLANPPIMTRAFLALFDFYDASQKQLQEANQALQNAVLDDPDFQEIL